MHVQKRQAGLLKSDKRDALGLANHLYDVPVLLYLLLKASSL